MRVFNIYDIPQEHKIPAFQVARGSLTSCDMMLYSSFTSTVGKHCPKEMQLFVSSREKPALHVKQSQPTNATVAIACTCPGTIVNGGWEGVRTVHTFDDVNHLIGRGKFWLPWSKPLTLLHNANLAPWKYVGCFMVT